MERQLERERRIRLEAERIAEEATRRQFESLRELERKNRDLEQYTHIISHDFKEPGRRIKSLCSMLVELEGGALSPPAAQVVSQLEKAATRMAELVDDFRLLVSVSSEGPAERSRVELADLVRDCLDSEIQSSLADRGVAVSVERCPGPLHVNAGLFRQLYANLIGNALKYMCGSGNELRFTCVADDPDSPWILGVRNTGSEVAEERLEEVFLPLRRLQPDVPGTGMGLAIARKIVERHGGRIWMESRDGAVHVRFVIPDVSEVKEAVS